MKNSTKEAIFNHLGFFNCLPISILAWVAFLILYILGQFEGFYWTRSLMMIWDAKENSWLEKQALIRRGWAGFAFGCNILVVDVEGERWKRTIKHESVHVKQQYKWGILFPILYIFESLRIYFFEKDLHSYYDNKYEKEARREAGQLVEIPKELWKDGPRDRWSFW